MNNSETTKEKRKKFFWGKICVIGKYCVILQPELTNYNNKSKIKQ